MAKEYSQAEWDALTPDERAAAINKSVAEYDEQNSAGNQLKETAMGVGLGTAPIKYGEAIKGKVADYAEEQGWDFWNNKSDPIISQDVAGPTSDAAGLIGTQSTQAFDQAAQEVQNRRAAQAAAAQVGNASAIDAAAQAQLGNQASLISALQGRAAGTAPSAAELQLQRATDDAIRAAQAQAAGQVGLSAGQAARLGATQQAAAIQDAAGQAAILRAQEQAQAEQTLAGVLGTARGQDLQGASLIQDRLLTQAGMDQATVMANLQSEQGQRALNDQMTQMYIAQGFSRDQARQQAAMDLETLKADIAAANADRALAASQAQAQADAANKSGMLGLAGSAIVALSDKRMKTDIKEAKNEVDDLLGALKAYSFKYKDNKEGDAQVGIMAQDAEKTKLGSSFVDETEEGKKYLTPDKALGAILASLGRLSERMDILTAKGEKKNGKKDKKNKGVK